MLCIIDTHVSTDTNANPGDWGTVPLPRRRFVGTADQIGTALAGVLLGERADGKVPVRVNIIVRDDPEVLNGRQP